MNLVYQSQVETTTYRKNSKTTKISTVFTRGKAMLRFTFFVVMSLLLLSNSASAQTATVQTDLLDYPPGATAIITGTGWQPGETVTLQVLHVDGDPLGADPQYHSPFTIVADATGNITSSWYVPNDGDALGAHFILTANGGNSSLYAEWFFTDGTLTISTNLLNKAIYCQGQEMIIYFSTTGTTAGFNKSNFSAQISNPGGQFTNNSPILTTTSAPIIISTDGVTTYWKMGVTVPTINSGGGNHYSIRVNYDPTPLAGYPEIGGSPLEQVRNALIQLYGSVTAFSLTVSNSGNACPSGVTITLNGSEVGVSYQLYRNGIAVGSSKIGISCTGGGCSILFTGIFIGGTYTVIGSINGGCVGNMSNSVTVTSGAVAAPVVAEQNFCSGTPASPTVGNLPQGGGTYKWYDNLFNLLSSTTLLSTGTYYVTQTSSGCESAPTTVNVKVPASPSFSLGSSSTRCQAAGDVLYTATGAASITYSLDATSLGAGNFINSSTGLVTYVAGYYGISTVAATATGCSGTIAATHTVTTNQNLTAGSIFGSTSVCQGANGIIYSISPLYPASSYTWAVPSGTSIASGQGSKSITVNFTTVSSGNITVIPVGACVSGGSSLPVSTTTSGAAIGPITGNDAVCAGATGQVYSIPSVTGTITWTVPADATITSGQGTTSITVSFGTTSDVISVSSSKSCGSTAKAVTVNVPPTIAASNIGPINNDLNICGASITLGSNITVNSGSPTITYSLTNFGTVISNPYTFPVGTTTVFAKATNSCGSDTKSFTVTIRDNQAPTFTTTAGSLNRSVECSDAAGLTAAQALAPTATDNCGSVIYEKTSGTFAAGSCGVTGSYTNTWVAKDARQNTSTVFTQIITVKDNIAPVLAVPNTISKIFEPSLCGSRADYSITATDNCIGAVSVVRTAGLASGSIFPIGENTVVYKATDACGNVTTKSFKVIVAKVAVTPILTLTALNNDGSERITTTCVQQYSDKVRFKAVITNGFSTCSLTDNAALSATFKLSNGLAFQIMGTQNFVREGANLVAVLDASLLEGTIGIMNPNTINNNMLGEKVVSVDITNSNSVNYDVQSVASKNLTITKEDAIAYYTGALLATTASLTSSQVSINLSATINDITAINPASDGNQGDIRNARVKFVRRDGLNTDLTGWLTPGLLNSNDTKIGFVQAPSSFDIGNNDAQQFTVGIIVEGYYTNTLYEENVVITVTKPIPDLVTGGGYIWNTNASGNISPVNGKRSNFGFNIKRTKTGTLQGNVNFIIRSGDGKIYQAKGNAMSTLSVSPATATSPAQAVFTGKANLQDITNPLAPISIAGNLNMQLSVTDRGEPGVADDILMIVYDKDNSTVLFTSNFESGRMQQQVIAAGNIKVHSTASYASGTAGSSTSLVSSLNPSPQSQPVTFTTTVTGSGTIKPTGKVQFVDVTKGTLLATADINTTTGIAACTTSTLTVGQHQIAVFYGGDTRYASSSAQLNQVIDGVITYARAAPVVVEKVATPKEVVSEIPLQIAIGPVPSNSKFTLQVFSSSNELINMIILDINGQVIQKITLAKGSTIDFGSNYRAGSYFVQVIQGKQKVLRKIIKF